ncbi:NAD-dependent epimerase/dehydratase family protein [Methylomagnum sp.]
MRLIPVDLLDSELLRPMAGTCCLVTGASGFLGRNLLATLLAADAEVHLTTHSRPAGEIPHGGEAQAHACDLTQLADVERVFDLIRPEFVFHLATGRGDEIHGRDSLLGNALSADRLVRASLRYPPRRLIAAASSLEYGPQPLPLREDLMLAPSSLYGATKAASTLLFRQAALNQGLPITVLRIFSIYGYWEPAKRLIPTAMRAALDQLELPMTPTGPKRDFVFVSDVVEALLLAAQAEIPNGEIINVGTGLQTGNEEAVAKIQAVSGLPIRVKSGAYPQHATDTDFWCADRDKALRLLGWQPRHDLDGGLRKTWRWFRDVGHRHL